MFRKSMVPNFITSMNLFSGILAIIYAFKDVETRDITLAGLFIMLAMILDALDGRIARMLNVTGDFGKELDSLADVVTFGAAPALILYSVSFHELGTVGLILTGLFPVCGALRLARFNTETHKVPNYFVGIPITAAGGILTLFAVNFEKIKMSFLHDMTVPFFMFLVLLLAFLMVSNIRVPNFKKVRIPKHIYIATPLMGIAWYAVDKMFPFLSIYSLLAIPFILLFVILTAKTKSKKRKLKNIEEEQKQDALDS